MGAGQHTGIIGVLGGGEKSSGLHDKIMDGSSKRDETGCHTDPASSKEKLVGIWP